MRPRRTKGMNMSNASTKLLHRIVPLDWQPDPDTAGGWVAEIAAGEIAAASGTLQAAGWETSDSRDDEGRRWLWAAPLPGSAAEEPDVTTGEIAAIVLEAMRPRRTKGTNMSATKTTKQVTVTTATTILPVGTTLTDTRGPRHGGSGCRCEVLGNVETYDCPRTASHVVRGGAWNGYADFYACALHAREVLAAGAAEATRLG